MATVHLIGPRDGWAPRADEPDTSGTSVGEWLRRAREARGLTLDDISRQTRIPRRHLEGIERGTLGLLPDFYHRAEVRTFAQSVGVDEQLAMARLLPATPVEVREAERPAQAAPRHSTTLVALAIGTIILASGLVWRGVSERPPGAATRSTASWPLTPPPPRPEDSANRNSGVAADTSLTAVPDSHAAATGVSTELFITTQPTGARVTVNGIGWGLSPVAVRHLPPGDKRIRVSKDGYRAAERALVLDAGRPQSVDIDLAPAP